MKHLNSLKKILVLTTICFSITGITACGNSNTSQNEKQNSSYQFVNDSALEKYNDKSLLDKVLNGETWVDTPMPSFLTDNNIGVLCSNGILIFDKSNGKLSTVIDTAGLGFERVNGDDAILESANNDYLTFHKASEKQGYVYSFKENAISKIEDVSKVDLGENLYSEVKDDEYKKMNSIFGGFTGPLKYKNNYIIVQPNFDNIKNSSVLVLDEKFNEVMSFKIG